MNILIGTKNRGKIIEIQEVLQDLPVTLLSPEDVTIHETPLEEGDTYEANALQKARFYYEQSDLPTIADDSGILVEALQNELGIHTRRWGAGPDASDEEWITYFLQRMEQKENRRAHFVCMIAYIDHSGAEHFFEGRCSGVITPALEADYLPGLPISACFKPDGFDAVFSALSLEQKNSTSHRGKGVHLLREHLKNSLGDMHS